MKTHHVCGHKVDPTSPKICRACRAAGMRKHRAEHDLTPTERMKMNCRSYTHVYVKRGKLKKGPCAVCGCPEVQAHHTDYSQPLKVVWLCLAHHRLEHRS